MMTLEEKREKKAQRIESQKRIDAAKQETLAVVQKGTCPNCGGGLRRNLSLTGWWQCEQSGAEGFRKDSSKPPCSWQGFV